MVQDAVGTNPVAEDAPEQQRRDDQQQAPQQTHVNRVRGDGRGEGNQRVKFEEQRNRIALEIPQVDDKDEKQKQAEEKNLRYAAGGAELEQVFHVVANIKRGDAENAELRRDDEANPKLPQLLCATFLPKRPEAGGFLHL